MPSARRLFSPDVTALIRDLDQAPARVQKDARAVRTKGAVNIKKDARRRAGGLAHAPAYPYAIGFDVSENRLTYEAEIGPDKDARQGALGNILEYGTINNAPIPHMGPALDAEEPKFVRALEDAAVKALRF